MHAIAAAATLAGEVHAVVVAGPGTRMEAAKGAHVKRLLRTCRAIAALQGTVS